MEKHTNWHIHGAYQGIGLDAPTGCTDLSRMQHFYSLQTTQIFTSFLKSPVYFACKLVCKAKNLAINWVRRKHENSLFNLIHWFSTTKSCCTQWINCQVSCEMWMTCNIFGFGQATRANKSPTAILWWTTINELLFGIWKLDDKLSFIAEAPKQ